MKFNYDFFLEFMKRNHLKAFAIIITGGNFYWLRRDLLRKYIGIISNDIKTKKVHI